MFNPKPLEVECKRQAEFGYKPPNNYMQNRWDTHGAFIAGGEFQYKLMIEENNRLRMLVADVLHGWLPEDAGPGFDWDTWADLAFREIGDNGVTGKSSV